MGTTAPPPPGVPASRIAFGASIVRGDVGDDGGAGADAYDDDGDDDDKAGSMILSTSAFRTLPPRAGPHHDPEVDAVLPPELAHRGGRQDLHAAAAAGVRWILAITVVDDTLAAWRTVAAVNEGQQQHVAVGGAVDGGGGRRGRQSAVTMVTAAGGGRG